MLLVEDDRVAGAALSTILTRRGFQVTWVETVGSALAEVDGGFAAVILDLMLPDGDGEVVLRHIRMRGGLPPRVLVTTASNDPARLSGVRALSPTAVLGKPLELATLMNLLLAGN